MCINLRMHFYIIFLILFFFKSFFGFWDLSVVYAEGAQRNEQAENANKAFFVEQHVLFAVVVVLVVFVAKASKKCLDKLKIRVSQKING